MSILRGLGPAHALSIPLDAYELHHGTLVGILLPDSVAFVAPAVDERRMDRLARAVGCDRGDEVPQRLRELNRAIGLPSGLTEMNVNAAVLPEVAALAAQSFFNQSSARQGNADEYLALVTSAMHAGT